MNDDGENLIAAAIGDAEEILDPIEGLVERSASDPGAAFAPEVLERLGSLKKENRAVFELLRAQLKRLAAASPRLTKPSPKQAVTPAGAVRNRLTF